MNSRREAENTIILENKNEEIKTQRDNIKEKNKKINDSIGYSKVIQKTLLESNQKIPYSQHFEYSESKNLVGGDIWFSKVIGDYFVI